MAFWLSLLLLALADEPPKPQPVYTSVTVTATIGREEQAAEAAPAVAVRTRDDLQARHLPVIAAALDDAPGILAQQSTAAQASPFLRGLTGYQVLNLLDGVRFNNATFRSGPNQYLAWLEPSQARQVEAALGPVGALSGSDALGGAIQVLTIDPPSGASARPEWHLDSSLFAASADRSAGASARLLAGFSRLSWLAGASFRRHNDIRAGAASDSRHALRRFFNLDDALITSIAGPRLRNTSFSQDSAHAKLVLRPSALHSLTAWYQFGEQRGVDGYKDLWGGLGRMRSAFEPQRLHFGYLRGETLRVPGLHRLSGTVSINSQADGAVRQGLISSGAITTERSRLDSHGYAVQAARQWSGGGSFTFGGELYDEHVRASRFDNAVPVRPLYPDGSRYTTAGLYAQGVQELFARRLRLLAGARFTRVGYAGLAYRDTTFNGSLTWRITRALELHVLGGRGFRAPNLNDLGAIGLNDLGYEIPAVEARNALIGSGAGEAATSTGRPVRALKAESLWNAEAGLALRAGRLYARAHFFHADLIDPISRRTLLYSSGSVPAALAGLPVTPIPQTPAQAAQQVVTVATAADPRAVKAFVNDGQSLYYGTENQLHLRLAPSWRLESAYAFIAGRDLYPNRNIRRLPPQSGFAALRYAPSGRKPWVEFRASAAGAQRRLSGGDLDDERIGASRSRADIAAFFNGSRIAPWLTTSGLFAPTGESLAQIQNRVLPGVANTLRVPLYTSTAGWLAFSLRGGFPLTEQFSLNAALDNLADRNYRIHGSGVDSPGRGLFLALQWRF